jgi:hypothetical protein
MSGLERDKDHPPAFPPQLLYTEATALLRTHSHPQALGFGGTNTTRQSQTPRLRVELTVRTKIQSVSREGERDGERDKCQIECIINHAAQTTYLTCLGAYSRSLSKATQTQRNA